jgi:hypothetical protein
MSVSTRLGGGGGLLRILVGSALAVSALVVLVWLLSGSASTPRLQNTEVIEWVDWRGRVRRVVIHRRVE